MSGFHKLSEVRPWGHQTRTRTHPCIHVRLHNPGKDVTQNLRQGYTRGSEERGAEWVGDAAKEASEEERRVSEQGRVEQG